MSMSSASNDRQQFDQWSESYEHSYLQWLLFDRVHRAVIKQLPAGVTPTGILDIGCGTGRLLRRLHTEWPKATLVGIDFSEGMVTKARQLTPTATIYQASSDHMPLQDDSVDLVTTTMSFHHWSDQVHGVHEAYRVLQHGGYFILADTNIGHGSPLSRSQVKALLSSSGYKIKSQRSFLPFLTITVAEKT